MRKTLVNILKLIFSNQQNKCIIIVNAWLEVEFNEENGFKTKIEYKNEDGRKFKVKFTNLRLMIILYFIIISKKNVRSLAYFD